MAVSADGYVCRGPDDDMRWTGKADKQLFRAQTWGCIVGAGTTTYRQMPWLPGRTLVRITRDEQLDLFDRVAPMTLGAFASLCPDAWLIGGQTVLLAAIQEGLVDRVLLSHVDAELGEGVRDQISPLLFEMTFGGGRPDLDFERSFFPQRMEGEPRIETWRLIRRGA